MMQYQSSDGFTEQQPIKHFFQDSIITQKNITKTDVKEIMFCGTEQCPEE